MTTDETLNELLVRLFKDIMEIEGKCLVTEEFKDLSYNDFHVPPASFAKRSWSFSRSKSEVVVSMAVLI